jgi:molybdopterin converting factor subunit 1
MNVHVKLFAVAAQIAAVDALEVPIDAGATVAELRRAMAKKCPALAGIMPHLMIAVDNEYVADPTQLREGAEIACIPPVSGG